MNKGGISAEIKADTDHSPVSEANSGVICVNKASGMTSHDVVGRIRKIYSTKQVGHTGTLDPMASGVLPVMVGRAVKASEYFTSERKSYRAEITFGYETDTLDSTGTIVRHYDDALPDLAAIESCIAHFTGKIMQTPPMYSALKVGGQKLYELARKGIEVERTAREIYIYSLTVSKQERHPAAKADNGFENGAEYAESTNADVGKTAPEGVFRLDIDCSKGTYIRSLCADIGSYLGCGAVMSALERRQSGSFCIEKSFTLSQLESMDRHQLFSPSVLLPVETLFSDLEKVTLPDFFAALAHNGNEIYLSKLKCGFPPDTRLGLYDKDGFFALGEVTEFPDGYAIKPIKQFRI